MVKKYAYPILPRAGFCNMLNPWARAFLWARDNGASMIAPNWVKLFRFGPWLRGERDKRYYYGMITNDGYISGWKKQMILIFKRKEVEFIEGQGRNIADFTNEHKALKSELIRIASSQIRYKLEQLPPTYIGVHIRRGDFKTIGLTLPAEYYIEAIRHAAKQLTGSPILVFSDACRNELNFLEGVGDEFSRLLFMPPAPALHDVLALARASLLVCTNGSSFSEWAAFLGRMPTIWSKDAFPIDDQKVGPSLVRI